MTKEDIKNVDAKEVTTGEVEEPKESKTYTQDELEQMVQSTTDKRVTEALKTQEAKFNSQLEKELEEAKKMASLTEAEQLEAQFEKEREAFEAEKAEFRKAKQRDSAERELLKRKLPTNFTNYVIAEDDEMTQENINHLEEQWKEALNEAVTQRMQGYEPKASNAISSVITKEDLKNMTYTERANFMENSPEEYARLNK